MRSRTIQPAAARSRRTGRASVEETAVPESAKPRALPGRKLRFLGDIEIRCGEESLSLPQSRKTRALLAYLAVSGKPHRRERLCNLLWDITDDPRAALRWSLSKLRPLVDEPGQPRILATRDTVSFVAEGLEIDVLNVRRQHASGIAGLPIAALQALAAEYRGEFLEGLELTDFHEFHAWCVATREELRGLQVRTLSALIDRLAAHPPAAVPFARELVQVDPLAETAHATLVRLLLAAGQRREAEQQYESGQRMLRDLGTEGEGVLRAVWAENARAPIPMATRPPVASKVESPGAAAPGADTSPILLEEDRPVATVDTPLLGREAELRRLRDILDRVLREEREHVVLLTGEPGAGKTRLLHELVNDVRRQGGSVLDGTCHEIEANHPYGPWIDALRRIARANLNSALSASLAPLLAAGGNDTAAVSRDRLFGAVVELLASRAQSAPPLLVLLDDVHWIDEASVDLMHYVIRVQRHRRALIALAARSGELTDNTPMCRLLRLLRRERLMDEVAVPALSRADTLALVEQIDSAADGLRIFAESAGNPLFTIELARSRATEEESVPSTLAELVRDRIARLPPDAEDLLRWSAVLGPSFAVQRLSALDVQEASDLLRSLDVIERHGLIRATGENDLYRFAHDLVHRVVYADLSAPRRRLMHRRVAQLLERQGSSEQSVVADLAHHAALAGDAALAAQACVAAGRRCLRLFANAEAYTLARRGMHHAEQLAEPQRSKLLLELLQVSHAARRPNDLDTAARHVEELAERALDHGCSEHARLGFHMLSYLRWEGGDWSAAQQQTLRAEMVSRTANESEHVVAMAEAGRCLAMLERDLASSEALLLEAKAHAARLGIEPVAVPLALGMLRLHQGHLEEAEGMLQSGRAIAQRERDRTSEFQSLEQLAMLELQRGRFDVAAGFGKQALTIAGKLREGSEEPFARALLALCAYPERPQETVEALERALADLRRVDAKYRLAFSLTRAAQMDLTAGDATGASRRAEEALRMAQVLQRPSEVALAQAVLVRAARSRGNESEALLYENALRRVAPHTVCAYTRRAIEAALGTQAHPATRRRKVSA